jgi:3'5'-cyclic nucleotide phosphodiesterase
VKVDLGGVNLHSSIISQLHDFISLLEGSHRANPFHKFEHSCLVLMSIQKMFERLEESFMKSKEEQTTKSPLSPLKLVDPLSLLAIAYAALVQNIDHPGHATHVLPASSPPSEECSIVTNSGTALHQRTKKTRADETAWSLLMQPQFADLRNAMFATEKESVLFRKIVEKAVSASNMFDIYAAPTKMKIDKLDDDKLSSSDLIEYIMRVSVFCHTMQPWSICEKWSALLFQEMYASYEKGLTSNPNDDWDQRECLVFDNVIFPLAQASRIDPACVDRARNALGNKMKWTNEGKVVVKSFAVRGTGAGGTSIDNSS